MRKPTIGAVILTTGIASVVTASFAQIGPESGQKLPLPAGSSWQGGVRCGAERWEAAIRVDPRDSGLAELMANVQGSTKVLRMRVSARGQVGSFELTPLEPLDSTTPFDVVSGTARTIERDGVKERIISWRPADGANPKCVIEMKFRADGLDQSSPTAAPVPTVTKLFGIAMNAPLDLPTCKVSMQQVRRCSPSGLSCWNETVRVQEQLPACFVPDRSHIRFDTQSQPPWAKGPIGVRLARDGRVVYIDFVAANGDQVIRELLSTFGSPSKIEGRDRSQGAFATCIVVSGVIDCKQTQGAKEWTEYTQVWRSSTIEARFDEGSNRTVVTLVSR